MERRFGTPFSDVRIHLDPVAQAVASSMHARALTHGDDIVFGAGEFVPGSSTGRRLLAHELAHVVQQRRGGRAPLPDGGAFESGLEADAERAADAACSPSAAVHVAASSAPGVSMAPTESTARPRPSNAPDRTDVSGGDEWREWLTIVEGMRWDPQLSMYTAAVENAVHAWSEREYIERRANVRAYFMNRLGDIRTGADGLQDAHERLRELHETWPYKPLYQWLAWKNDIWFPQEAFEEEILSARVYANQARITLAEKDAPLLVAFDHLESARTALETAVILLENYRDELLAASRSVAPLYGDAIDFSLGVLKGALAQVTDLADTAFWAADETRTAQGGLLQMAFTAPTMVPVALGHDVVKAAGAVDAQGRVSTTSVLTKAVDTASSEVQKTFGSQFSDRYFFTAGEIGELAGALGFQGLLLYTGVKEVQLVFDVGGAISSFRTMFNTYRDNPDWPSDPNFWAGAIGTLLGVIGLKNWKGKSKAIQWIVGNSAFINAAPAAWQLSKDLFDESLSDDERRKRVAEDTKRLANILLLPLVQRHVQGGRSPAPDADPETPPVGIRTDTADAEARDGAAPVDGARTGAARSARATSGTTAKAPEVGDDALPDNILPFRASDAPPRSDAPEGELVRGPWSDASTSDAHSSSANDEASQRPMDREAESELPMAVGYTPPADHAGPVLIHDADVPVASAGGRRRGPQRPPGAPARGGNVTRGPGVNPPATPPGGDPPRVFEARGRDRQVEVVREGKTLYTGKESAPTRPAEGQAARDEGPVEQQARRDRLAPGPQTDEVREYMLNPRLKRPIPDPAERAAALEKWKDGIARAHQQMRWNQTLADTQKHLETQRRGAAAGAYGPEVAGPAQEVPPAPRGTITPEGFVPSRTIVRDGGDARTAERAPGRTLLPEASAPSRTIVPEEGSADVQSQSVQEPAHLDPWDEIGTMEADGFWAARTGERTHIEDLTGYARSHDDEPTVEFDDMRRYPEDAPTEIIERDVLGPDDEPTVEIENRALDPDEEPTVSMRRPVRDPDEEPTVETQRPALDPDEEVTMRMWRPLPVVEPHPEALPPRPALDPDEEVTERIDRALPLAQGARPVPKVPTAMAEYEPTIEFADTTDQIVARPLDPVEATVEVEHTDPGAVNETAAAAPEGPPPRSPTSPEAQATAPEEAPATHTPPSVVPPDEHERARRRRRNRQPQ